MRIAVFCSSANDVGPNYMEAARLMGKLIGESGWELVYGGTNTGLMKEVADTTISFGGKVTGIIPECILKRGVAAENLENLIVVSDMKERKAYMREAADAFIALPGGWGTLEEITETITLKQLGEHKKPIVFLNISGFYDAFIKFINDITQQGFVSPIYERLYKVLSSVEEVIPYLEQYHEHAVVCKYK